MLGAAQALSTQHEALSTRTIAAVIRVSASKQIDALIADLAGDDEVRRDAAIARLTVIGARAVDRLLDVVKSTAPAASRAAALRTLEGIGDERALPAALVAVSDGDEAVALAAVRVARLFIQQARGAEVVDALTRVALDHRRPDAVRATAVRALRHLKAKTIAPLLKTLKDDASAMVREAVQGSKGSRGSSGSKGSLGSLGSRGSEGPLDWLVREGAKAPLTSVLELIERVRERERHGAAHERSTWTAVRFAAHHVLARRGSRIALYDLKETLEKSTTPLPADAVAALTLIADASCLEPIASAYSQSSDKRWRDQLLELFHAIVKREKLTPRHAVMRRVEKRLTARQ